MLEIIVDADSKKILFTKEIYLELVNEFEKSITNLVFEGDKCFKLKNKTFRYLMFHDCKIQIGYVIYLIEILKKEYV